MWNYLSRNIKSVCNFTITEKLKKTSVIVNY